MYVKYVRYRDNLIEKKKLLLENINFFFFYIDGFLLV